MKREKLLRKRCFRKELLTSTFVLSYSPWIIYANVGRDKDVIAEQF